MTKPDKNDGKGTPTVEIQRVAIDTYRENVAYMHRDCGIYRAEGFQALSKIEISANGQHIMAVLNVVDDENIVPPGALGLSEEAFNRLGVEERTPVHIDHAGIPMSMEAVRSKIEGQRLNAKEFDAIVGDIVDGRYSKMEIAAFLVASGQTGLDREEILYLTRAMVSHGRHLNWHETIVADKHCIGGIPGNRTSMLVVPIVAAHGTLIPKTSSRAITSPSGTADTMEVLADVELAPGQLHDVVRRLRGAIAWGGASHLAPVDDILISVERPLRIDYPGQMVASILSKKIAAGSTHLVIDIPVGPTSKVRHMREALALRKLFEYVGGRLGLFVEVVITDGRQPIGRGIGPVQEARDIMQVLKNDPNAPSDLRQKALRLAGRLIEFDPDVRGGDGFLIARDILDSGRALSKMNDIIESQGKQAKTFKPGQLTYDVTAPETGTVVDINNFQMARIARIAGAPLDKGAGVDLHKQLGDDVKKGDVLYTIHAEFNADFRFAIAMQKENNGYTLGSPDQLPNVFAEF